MLCSQETNCPKLIILSTANNLISDHQIYDPSILLANQEGSCNDIIKQIEMISQGCSEARSHTTYRTDISLIGSSSNSSNSCN
ncbi:hypothetical protein BpHYR1_000042 [Brachionus plicatilis]|uniref:Uncharacterized protein n=1 Tax=Brachionus plicatilis TaxID=10195 RepID=A0A3M7QKN2_BRAPC|nr:hypothetical protein BpHYR1_000042 [Brachionus plicatilis]